MAVPKKRTSRSKRNMRRSHDALPAVHTVLCERCAEPKIRHRICPSCGQYRGKQVVEVNDAEL